jgi:DNA-binding CsgD family transcriptional regulator
VIEGEPGIGKTTVWREVTLRAHELGYAVLAARPTAGAQSLSFSTLDALMAQVDDSLLDELPGPARTAVDAALLRSRPPSGPPEPRAVATAFLATLHELARAQPVLVAVDDMQWVDEASWAILEYTARRLDESRTRILATTRPEAARAPFVSRSEDARWMRLDPLTVGALHLVLKRTLGHSFSRPLAVRIARASGGNPFYAVEIGRELLRRGGSEPGLTVALPVPSELVPARIAKLPGATREVLARCAALSKPTRELVDLEALEPAENAGIVRLRDDGRIEFEHPLFASAAYDALPPARRRSLHAQLATVVGDAEEVAFHLARSQPPPGPEPLAAIERGAEQARARGATSSAADLYRRASLLAPGASRDQARLLAESGRCWFEAGDCKTARELLTEAVAGLPRGRARAAALVDLAMVEEFRGDRTAASELCEAALEDAGGSRRLEAWIRIRLAYVAADFDRWYEEADAAVRLLEQLARPPSELIACALMERAAASLSTERGLLVDDVRRVRRLLPSATRSWERTRARYSLARWLLCVDRLDEANAALEELLAEELLAGDETEAATIAHTLAAVGVLRGDPESARRYATQARELIEQLGSSLWEAAALRQSAEIEWNYGDRSQAASQAEQALELVDPEEEPVLAAAIGVVLGKVAFARGDAVTAAEQLERADDLARGARVRDPTRLRHLGLWIEAELECGRLKRAEELVERLEAIASTTPTPWLELVAVRSRGLLVSTQGRPADAGELLDRAAALAIRLPIPLEQAQTLLALGKLQRRSNQRRAARSSLAQAEAIFESIGAEPWVDVTRAEIGRIGVRRAPQELTVNEERVAELAAAGLTNREIAAKLFLSRRTVEANLARAYRKLGIRSRAELGAQMAVRERA